MRIALIGAEVEENLAVAYIRGALESAGHLVRQVPFNAPEDAEGVARELAASGAELAGMSMVFTRRARQFADLAARARELGFSGHIIAGGHFAAFNAEQILRDIPAIDSVGVGEGEGLMCRLAADLPRLETVPGLVWRGPEGRIVRNPPAPKPADLDSLPEPVRRVPFDTYLGLSLANIVGSRGCTHACAFCSIAAWHKLCGGARFRLRSVPNLAAEMANLYRRGVRIFNFHDDNFILGSMAATLERARELAAALAAQGVGRIAIAIKARPDTVDEELFRELKALGLFRVFLGIEAGAPDSLRELGRRQSVDDNERSLTIVNRLDVHTCFNLLMLNPDSTLEDFAANVEFLRRHPDNAMNFCRTEIYAGTPLEARLRASGRLLDDYWGYDYRISEPGAQGIFEAVYPAFRERCFGTCGVHCLAMTVDYQHQLLAHFFGTDPALRARVKGYIREVNLNTVRHLETGVAAVRSGWASPAARTEFGQDLARRVSSDDARLYSSGQKIAGEILAAAEAAQARVWERAAAG
ncbi:MAG TPA: radical SAM protein [Planctomycetota bacterium]|nr:radical SAM protein [Planctomycetota bacterium]